MHTIDMHCDTLMHAFLKNRNSLEKADIFSMPGSVDLDRLHRADAAAQFFAIFLLPVGAEKYFGLSEPLSDEEYIEGCARIFRQSLAAHSGIAAAASCADEICRNFTEGKVSAVLTMEDGRAVQGRMDNIRRFYDMGVRALSLTWNMENCFGSPNSKDPAVMSRGLTDFGRDAVYYMQELGMLVDVSHLSDGGFYDVADICRKPFVATHSNCRALSPHQRNLTDDMIRTLGNAGGVAGLNFGPEFLNEDLSAKSSTAALIASHARHMADVGGVGCVALGTDFDGIEGELEVGDPTKMDILASALREKSFTEAQIDMIFRNNAMRVIREAMK